MENPGILFNSVGGSLSLEIGLECSLILNILKLMISSQSKGIQFLFECIYNDNKEKWEFRICLHNEESGKIKHFTP